MNIGATIAIPMPPVQPASDKPTAGNDDSPVPAFHPGRIVRKPASAISRSGFKAERMVAGPLNAFILIVFGTKLRAILEIDESTERSHYTAF